jgi:hypothetical protein
MGDNTGRIPGIFAVILSFVTTGADLDGSMTLDKDFTIRRAAWVG